MVRKLQILNVPVNNVDSVIHTVANGININVKDHISTKAARLIMLEGGVMAELQLVHEVQQAEGITISGDGTTVKHINREAKHITLKVPTYNQNPAHAGNQAVIPQTHSMGISIAPSHTSEEQLEGWKRRRDDLYATYNASPLGESTPADPNSFAAKIRGMGSDHAEDQKKLARLIENWKEMSDILVRGRRYMEEACPGDVLPAVFEENNRKLEEAGGAAAWASLSQEERHQRDIGVYNRLCQRFGEEQWQTLTEGEKKKTRMFVWAGCCMHKEMNTVKGGARAMADYWKEGDLDGPVKLMNKDNDAAAQAGPSKARDQAIDNSQGGAVKLTDLAGSLFNHKDKKKGHQDTFRDYFEKHTNQRITFPDTSNTRFQSHCEAAIVLIVLLPIFLRYLPHFKDTKEKRNFNHLEANIFKGLQDRPTITELCVLALYAISISHPYMRVVRASSKINALDQKGVHDRVKTFCEVIISEPERLVGPNAGYEKGVLDGCEWNKADEAAFQAVQNLAESLPQLKACLVAFFRGALEKWRSFTTEFADDGLIASMTESERRAAWIPSTNDANEGVFGDYRTTLRRAPNMSLQQHNARKMYKHNKTEQFEKGAGVLTPKMKAFVSAEARRRDSSKQARRERDTLVQHDEDVVERKRRRDVERQEKADEVAASLRALDAKLDVRELETRGLALGSEGLIQQINWHRQFD
ncbi:hypothetical protein ARMGADRAFT_977390, partial [Armillaria gallica]